MSKPIVAIVGRPNVGKSTLFNKLIGKRLSIVDDSPGITRDRIYSECEWKNQKFMLIDTAGIEPKTKDNILSQMKKQAQIAIENADVIIFLVDLKSGVTATDIDVAKMIIKTKTPVILCVNKCDNIGDLPPEFYEFYNLGLGDPLPVSSIHGHGTGDLLDEVFKYLDFNQDNNIDENIIKVAVIGKPNAGKSSLVNNMCGQERAIVSDIAGTTRDSTDTIIQNKFGKFLIIDTAGIRKKSKIEENIEHYSVLRSWLAVERADVCITLIDAQEGFSEQDSKISGFAHEKGKASIVAINKWDLIEKTDKTMNEFQKKLENDFSFMSYAPFLFISAKTGQRVQKLFELINQVDEQHSKRIPTGRLNEILSYATNRVQPPTDKGKRLKIYYITQASSRPPTFVCFVNDYQLFHFSYQRYIENQIRENFNLIGTPIKLIIRERTKK
ncbi:MAG: ribosome biogenesis GTPase Der [Oscillospiraceae bacterium]|nr:ribosome biogenesis GTPase Der [Oscillospiraceae bacterium]